MVIKEEVDACLACGSKESELISETKTMMAPQTESWQFKKCLDCAMVYLSPRVREDYLSHYYTASYLPYRGPAAWGKYAKMVAKDLAKIDVKRVNTVKKYLPEGAKTILDIGCGKPSFLLKANQILGLEAIGQDFSDEGWKDEIESYNELSLFTGSLFDLPPSIEADAITMWHYLEHDYNPGKTLKHLSDTQPEDTILIIEVPNYDSKTRKKYGGKWSGFHSPRHTGLFTPDTMKSLLESKGWEVIDCYTYGTLDPYTLDWMSRMEIKGIDWTGSMEPYFNSYVLGKLMRPSYFFDSYFNLGFMTVVAKNKKTV